jgi:hypothetical protein
MPVDSPPISPNGEALSRRAKAAEADGDTNLFIKKSLPFRRDFFIYRTFKLLNY